MGSADDIESRVVPAPETNDDAGAAPTKPAAGVGREHLHASVPPHDTYEGRHRFDPQATWSAQEERRVVRKTDLYLLSWLCAMVSTLNPPRRDRKREKRAVEGKRGWRRKRVKAWK